MFGANVYQYVKYQEALELVNNADIIKQRRTGTATGRGCLEAGILDKGCWYKDLPDEWYNTANLHMCTIKDFFYFVKSKDIKIFKSLALNNLNTSLINDNNLGIKNMFADLGIFLIEK